MEKMKTIIQCRPEVSKEAFFCLHMKYGGIMHMLRQFGDTISNIRTSQGYVLKRPNQVTVLMLITRRCVIIFGDVKRSGHKRAYQFGIMHAVFVQQITNVPPQSDKLNFKNFIFHPLFYVFEPLNSFSCKGKQIAPLF